MLSSSSVLLACILCVASCATTASEKLASPATSAPVATEYDDLQPNPMLGPKVYTDGVGIVVELLPLKVPDGETAQALLRITGVKSYIAGVTFRARRKVTDTLDAWIIDLNGVDARIVQRTIANYHTGKPLLFVPRGRGRIQLQQDEAAGERLDSVDLIADHKEHLSSGLLAKLAKFDRDYARSVTQGYNDRALKEFAEHCGKDVEVKVDWDSFQSPDDFRQSGICKDALRIMAGFCSDRLANKVDIVAKVDVVDCKLSKEPAYGYSPGSKTWKIHSTSSRFSVSDANRILASKTLNLGRTLLKSSQGLYVVLSAPHEEMQQIFAGKGPKLYRQHSKYRSSGRAIGLWGGTKRLTLSRRDLGKWEIDCPKQVIEFEEAGLAERDRVLASSTFEEPIWRRNEKVLARDTKGTYYYVDEIRREFGGLGYRVFKGPRGRLKLTTMVDIIDDPKGQIFATTSGSLRLILGKDEAPAARWLVGRRSEELENIDVWGSGKLIYQDLGIYAGEELGTICSLAAAGDSGP